MGTKLKEIILGSVKIAASYSKEKATIEDFILSMMENDNFLSNIFNYIGINPKDFEVNIIDLNKL
jgi:hypothetical protein